MSIFGDIRSVLQEPASAQGWEALCALFERAPESTAREQLLPYVRAHLDRHWPVELRVWDKRWTRRVIRGNTILVAGLAMECDLRNRQLNKQSVERLMGHDYIHGLRVLNLAENHHLGEALEQLAKVPLLRDVHELHLGDCNTARHRDVSAFFDCSALSKLKTLDLGYYGGLSEHLRLLGMSEVRHTLESLTCSFYHQADELISFMHMPMPALRELKLNISDEQLPQLMMATESAVWWSQIEHLTIKGATDGRAIWQHRPSGLKTLNLETRLNTSSLEQLAMCEGLETLEELWIQGSCYESNFVDLVRCLHHVAARRLADRLSYTSLALQEYLDTLPPNDEGSPR